MFDVNNANSDWDDNKDSDDQLTQINNIIMEITRKGELSQGAAEYRMIWLNVAVTVVTYCSQHTFATIKGCDQFFKWEDINRLRSQDSLVYVT